MKQGARLRFAEPGSNIEMGNLNGFAHITPTRYNREKEKILGALRLQGFLWWTIQDSNL